MKLALLKLLLVVIALSLLGCAGSQKIEEDATQWPEYKIVIGANAVRFRLPPGGKIFQQPPESISVAELKEGYNQFVFIGYDYGNKYSDKSASFRLVIGFNKFAVPLEAGATLEQFTNKIVKEESNKARLSFGLVKVEQQRWLHERFSSNIYSESYSLPLAGTHYLSIGAGFLDDIVENSELFEKRKLLLRKIVSLVSVIEAN